MTAPKSEDRALATLSVLAVLPWLIFHLFREWAAFSGREAWLARSAETSGPAGIGLHVVEAGLLLALGALFVRALVRGGPLPGHAVGPDDAPLVRLLAGISRPALGALLGFVVVHAGWLALPLALGRVELAETYESLRVAAGTPLLLVVHAVGLSATALHVAASLPAWLVATGRVSSTASRRSAAVVASGLGACLFVLAVQLYGWHATGAGTVWPVIVLDPAAELPAE